jgi:hypothetical protein
VGRLVRVVLVGRHAAWQDQHSGSIREAVGEGEPQERTVQ